MYSRRRRTIGPNRSVTNPANIKMNTVTMPTQPITSAKFTAPPQILTGNCSIENLTTPRIRVGSGIRKESIKTSLRQVSSLLNCLKFRVRRASATPVRFAGLGEVLAVGFPRLSRRRKFEQGKADGGYR